MNDEKIIECLFDIKTQVAEIAANQKNFQTIIANHENRLMKLEGTKVSVKDDDFKTELLKLLAKCVLIGLTVIASLAGAGGLLNKLGAL